MEAGDVFIRLTQMKLGKNIGANVFRCASGEGGNRTVGKALAEAAQLAVFGTEFVSPLGDAVRFINGEKCDRHLLQPTQGIGSGQALGAKIEQPASSVAGHSGW